MNIIIVTENDRIDNYHFKLSDFRFEHIRDILKSGIGDTVELGLLNIGSGTGTVESISKSEVIISCGEFKPEESIIPNIDLICALPRPQTLKKVLFSSGMMAVRSLHLIRANRVEKSYYHSPLLDKENYERFLIEGMMQGKINRMPKVTIHERFKPFFEDTLNELITDDTLKLLPEIGIDKMLNKVYSGQAKHIVIAIGPEGGWVPFEIDLMTRLGFLPVSLGRWTLRVEHAVTAILSQIEMIRGEK